MNLSVYLHVAGALLILLAALHVFLPGYSKWSEELPKLGLFTRHMVVVHTVFIALVSFLMGLLFLSCAADLQSSAFGRKIAGALCLFWFVRLISQFTSYPSELWKGKRFETLIHGAATAFWLYLTGVLGLVAAGV